VIRLTREPEPPALVPDQSDCFNIGDIESRLPLCRPLAYLDLLRNRCDYVRPPRLARLQPVNPCETAAVRE
jgi:hypothetical protein